MKNLYFKIKHWFYKKILGREYFIGIDTGIEDYSCEVTYLKKRDGSLEIIRTKFF